MSLSVKSSFAMVRVPGALLVLFLLVTCLSGCKWDPATYAEIESIQKEALLLVEASAAEQFTSREPDVAKLTSRINTIIALKRPKAGVSILTKISDEANNTWGGFVKKWRAEGTINPEVVPGIRKNINDIFNEALGLGKK